MANEGKYSQDELQAMFDRALDEAVHQCAERGLHSAWMIDPLRKWLKWAEDATATADKGR